MRHSNISMKTIVKRDQLLETLKINAAKHAKIVQEARDGYVKKAQEALVKRLEELRTGKIVSLHFSLQPPQDNSEVYRNCIKMLEWTTAAEVTLEADEFRQLVLDEWDWSSGFYGQNKLYSATANLVASEKGF